MNTHRHRQTSFLSHSYTHRSLACGTVGIMGIWQLQGTEDVWDCLSDSRVLYCSFTHVCACVMDS